MLNRKKVLILDPSPIFRITLKEVIQASEAGVDVSEATNADQATQISNNETPDDVFFDIALPKENGIEFIASIKSMVFDSRIVVLSSLNSVEYEAASIEKGADYFLSKENAASLRLIYVIHETKRRNSRS